MREGLRKEKNDAFKSPIFSLQSNIKEIKKPDFLVENRACKRNT
jgi:hypothetical protein